MANLEDLLRASAALHRHLCPRQVLGVRMGLLAGQALPLELPRDDKRLLVFVETDGCVVDGVSVSAGCYVGHRTLRVIDQGKVAATFLDTSTGHAIRIAPQPGIRERAAMYAPHEQSRWHTQLLGYQRMPDDELFHLQTVVLTISLEKLLSKPGHRAICAACGEEVLNEREIVKDGVTLCRACAGEGYYQAAS
ncbi:MAG: FmdE family protein [Chloroflexi bacterium]|nr:FmdE family protein [Chloroflexota bacterium]